MTRISSLARFTRHRHFFVAVAAVGFAATFGAMLALGNAAGIGAIGFAPWVMLIASDRGIGRGILAAGVATGLYSIVAAVDSGPVGPLAVSVRGTAFLVLAVGAGLLGNRLRNHERTLAEIVSRQTGLLDAALDGICLTDVAGNPLISNAPLRRISVELGLPATGTVPERLLAIADRTTEPARYRERMLRLANEPTEMSDDEFELSESGTVFRGYTAPILAPNGRLAGRIWTLRDVTSDRDLERLRDAFIAAISHELRTPLTSISGFLELLGDEEHELGETGRGYLTVIRRSTDRLQRIVEDILLVAQIEAHRLELSVDSVELADVAAAATEAARPIADNKGVTIGLHTGGGARVEADPQRLGQVLDNLVSNAVKFTAPGGTVNVAVEHDDSRARLVVTDTGVGIPPDEQAQLFSRFFRASTATRRAIPGTGLGLWIARAIVEQHGGTISLESEVGEGTRVTVALPVAR